MVEGRCGLAERVIARESGVAGERPNIGRGGDDERDFHRGDRRALYRCA